MSKVIEEITRTNKIYNLILENDCDIEFIHKLLEETEYDQFNKNYDITYEIFSIALEENYYDIIKILLQKVPSLIEYICKMRDNMTETEDLINFMGENLDILDEIFLNPKFNTNNIINFLLMACMCENIIHYIITNYDIDVNKQDYNGINVLILLVRASEISSKDKETIKLILTSQKVNVDLTLADYTGQTAYDYAVQLNNEITELFKEYMNREQN